MKRLSIFLLPLLLAGCAQKVPVPDPYAYATLKYDTTNTKADVIADWGVPTKTIKMNDTQTAYQWDSDNGSTSSGTSVGVSEGFGSADTETCLGCGGAYTEGDSTTISKSSSSGNVATHACALYILADNKTDKIVKANFTGTVDAKCYQHFGKSVQLDANAVQRYKSAVATNEGIGKRRKILAVVGVLGGATAIAASN